MWVSLALLDGLPESGDDPERLFAALGVRRLNQPAANDHARPTNPAAAVYRADPTSALVVPQDVQDCKHELPRLGQGPILDRELVVLDLGEGNVVCAGEVGKVGCVWGEFTGFGEVDEGADPCCKDFVELLGRGFEGRPGVFASEELGRCPVGVRDGAWGVGEEGWKGRAALRLAVVDGGGGDC